LRPQQWRKMLCVKWLDIGQKQRDDDLYRRLLPKRAQYPAIMTKKDWSIKVFITRMQSRKKKLEIRTILIFFLHGGRKL